MIKTWKDMVDLFDFDPFALLDRVVKESEVKDVFVEFNQDQLQDGKDALGQTIVTIGGNPYRPMTIRMKKKNPDPKAKADTVTLYETGSFYNTFQVVINKNDYEITANFSKGSEDIRDNFQSKYDFLGLDKESLNEIANEIIYPRLYNVVRKQFGL